MERVPYTIKNFDSLSSFKNHLKKRYFFVCITSLMQTISEHAELSAPNAAAFFLNSFVGWVGFTEFHVVTAGVANTKFFSLATNFPCFSLIEIFCWRLNLKT